MPEARESPPKHTTAADTTEAVSAFMAKLDHPYKAEIEAIRQAILGADPRIREGVKWNAPSFRTTEYFATMHLRAKGGIGVILHLGAKVRDIGADDLAILDSAHLLRWLAKDRASLTFSGLPDFLANEGTFADLIRQWIRHV
jgi:hypothetical protein